MLPENNRWERIWKIAQVDFKKRYYNDRLGLFWALLNPIFRIFIYYMAFTHVFKIAEPNYAQFLFAGLVLWLAWSECTNRSMNILLSKRFLIENIQFNKIDLFISHTISSFMGMTFNLTAFIIFLLLSGIALSKYVLFLPILLIILFILCLGASLILSTIKIYLKDIVHIWTMILLAGFWSSGLFNRAEGMIEAFPPLKFINPFVGLIINARNITMYSKPLNLELLIINACFGLVTLIVGVFVFKKFSHKATENI